MAHTVGRLSLIVLVVLLGSGCGRAGPYVVSDLTLARSTWDSLQVGATFSDRTWWGGTSPVAPDTASLFVFDGRYDTLYAGPLGRLALPDRRLGDRERLLVEVCGTFGKQTVCEQEGLNASPKQIRVTPDIEYPVENDMERGRYVLDYTVERQRFDSSAWEPVTPIPKLQAYLMAYIAGQEQAAVRVPLTQRSGDFHLARYKNYNDFSFQLHSTLYEGREAQVRFDVYAGLNEQAHRLVTVERAVREKQRSERQEEVRHFVQEATRLLLERLAEMDHPHASVYVDTWRFNNIISRYVVEMEVRWENERSFFRRRHRLRGVLEVNASGERARFRFEEGDHRAEERWNEQVGREVMELPRLELPKGKEEAVEADRALSRRDEPAPRRSGPVREPGDAF